MATSYPGTGTGPEHFPLWNTSASTAPVYVDKAFATLLRRSADDRAVPPTGPTMLVLTLVGDDPDGDLTGQADVAGKTQ